MHGGWVRWRRWESRSQGDRTKVRGGKALLAKSIGPKKVSARWALPRESIYLGGYVYIYMYV